MKEIFDNISFATSKLATKSYSTSFSWGIYCLDKKFHNAIYGIYGFVRFADEIVDTFHTYDKKILLDEFKTETYKAIKRGISLNPIINSFQHVVNAYHIDSTLIDCFFQSMETDLQQHVHSPESYKKYILGSAEVIGLMCLNVFTERNSSLYEELKPTAMLLGSAFQKVNFLRDMKTDYQTLGRVYFPHITIEHFSEKEKKEMEKDIEGEFESALKGIKKLPISSRFGVYVAYVYYRCLFKKIKSTTSTDILKKRIRVPNYQKLSLLIASFFRYRLRTI